MKYKPIRCFLTGNALPQKSELTVKGCFGLEDELYYVGKEHITSRYRPIGLHTVGRFFAVSRHSPYERKGSTPPKNPPTERG
jgi:hypothetical protein